MANKRIGALIVLERDTDLTTIVEMGTEVSLAVKAKGTGDPLGGDTAALVDGFPPARAATTRPATTTTTHATEAEPIKSRRRLRLTLARALGLCGRLVCGGRDRWGTRPEGRGGTRP